MNLTTNFPTICDWLDVFWQLASHLQEEAVYSAYTPNIWISCTIQWPQIWLALRWVHVLVHEFWGYYILNYSFVSSFYIKFQPLKLKRFAARACVNLRWNMRLIDASGNERIRCYRLSEQFVTLLLLQIKLETGRLQHDSFSPSTIKTHFVLE